MNIAIISSSIRKGRQTHKVSLALMRLLKNRNDVSPLLVDLGSNDIPLMEATLSSHENPPQDVAHIGETLKSADAMIFVSPEYTGSYSPALQNLLDYFDKTVFEKKVIGIASVSAGKMGGIRGALQMQQLVLALFAFPVPSMLLVDSIYQKLDAKGNSLDKDFDHKVDFFLDEFLWLASAVDKKKRPTH